MEHAGCRAYTKFLLPILMLLSDMRTKQSKISFLLASFTRFLLAAMSPTTLRMTMLCVLSLKSDGTATQCVLHHCTHLMQVKAAPWALNNIQAWVDLAKVDDAHADFKQDLHQTIFHIKLKPC